MLQGVRGDRRRAGQVHPGWEGDAFEAVPGTGLFAGKAEGRVRVTAAFGAPGMGEVRVSEGVQGVLTHCRASDSVRACSGTLSRKLFRRSASKIF